MTLIDYLTFLTLIGIYRASCYESIHHQRKMTYRDWMEEEADVEPLVGPRGAVFKGTMSSDWL